MNMTLEPRAYGPDSTPDEIEMIKARVHVYVGLAALGHGS
jgi:hypothetical protein